MKKLNTIDKILIFCTALLLLFTITMIVIFCIYQDIPNTLVEAVFGLASSETIITFAIWWIKKKATNKKEKDNERLEK